MLTVNTNVDPNIETNDLRGVPCPINAARAILSLEMSSADQMLILLDDGDPIENVRESLQTAGFPILKQSQNEDTTWQITVSVNPS